MTELIFYTFKVSVCMILLYGLYILALSRETNFRFNRIYLLSSLIISLIIPVLNIAVFSNNSATGFTAVLQTVQVQSVNSLITGNNMSFANYIFCIYITGLFILTIQFIMKLVSLLLIRKESKIERSNGFYIAFCKKSVSPFSFFHTIYIDEKIIDDTHLDKIMMHETIHVRQLHSFDIVFTEIICLLTWFNPVSWMIKSALKETHEYLADSGVSEQTTVSAEYFLLLFRNAIGVQPGLANNFNKSLTLKRINMMKKPRSGRLSMLKVLPVLPILALLFFVFSCTNSTDDSKSKNNSAPQAEEKTIVKAEKMPEFPGGQDAMTKFIIENVNYPEAAKKAGIQGKVLVTFNVAKSGKIENIRITQKVNDNLDKEALRVVSIMPDWVPGEAKGTPVDVEITLPIVFKLA